MPENFQLWMDTRCMIHPRVAGGLSTLLRDFNNWNRVVAITRGVLVDELDKKGFRCVEVERTWLVLGLCLKEDAEMYLGASSPSGAEEGERRLKV